MNFMSIWFRPPTVRAEPSRRALFECVSRTHVGSRERNEDRLLERLDLGLWAVADGMGGHHGGDAAAQCVIDELSGAEPRNSREIEAAIDRANARVHSGALNGITGSTLVALRICGSLFECHWVGDSELWLVRNGEPRKITRDHSVVEELIRCGVIDERQRHTHPQRNVITRAVGIEELVEVDRAEGTVFPRDLFLLCSDGLSKALTPRQWNDMLQRMSLEAAADEMISHAIAAPRSDNVTLIAVRVE
jgi:serine/threonine-protein phosphatase Stp1